MVERVRPQRFGLNQNYIFPNKERSFWQSAPLSYQNKNAIIKAIYQYNFDGIDDYAQLPAIPLFVGDVVEFDFVAVSTITRQYFLDGVSGSSRLYIIQEANTADVISPLGSKSIDGAPSSTFPTDDIVHTFTGVATSELVLGTIGSVWTAGSQFKQGVIKNLRITRANPTDQYPDLFYPMDDGLGTTVMRQVLPTADNWDGTYVNFNDERWELV